MDAEYLEVLYNNLELENCVMHKEKCQNIMMSNNLISTVDRYYQTETFNFETERENILSDLSVMYESNCYINGKNEFIISCGSDGEVAGIGPDIGGRIIKRLLKGKSNAQCIKNERSYWNLRAMPSVLKIV